MKRLLYFFYGFRVFIVFIVLEIISIKFVSTYRSENASILSANNYIVGNIYSFIDDIISYPSIKEANNTLLQENAVLHKRLIGAEQTPCLPIVEGVERYDLVPARVINNSIINARNYITIDKGSANGVAAGMGVMSSGGVVGKVKAVSEHFSTVMSLLHSDVLISAKVKEAGVLGTVRWPGNDISSAKLLYVPMHVKLEKGDTVITSGYSSTFFEGLLIGYIKDIRLEKNASFYEVDISLSTDFSSLNYVYVIKNSLIEEKNNLEEGTKNFYE